MKIIIYLVWLVCDVILNFKFLLDIFGIDFLICDGIVVCDYIYVEDLVKVYLDVFCYLENGGES